MMTETSFRFVKTAMTAAVTALLLGVGAASADIIIHEGTTSAGDTDNVIFASCIGANLGPANIIQGCLNTSHTTLVDFESGDTIEGTDSGGQARIEGQNGGTFDDLKIYFDNGDGFTKLSFNINTEGTDTGTVIITASGSELVVSGPLAIGNGANFFWVEAINGQSIDFVQFQSTIGVDSVLFDDVRQVRIGGPTVALPEPGALALFGVVLGAIGMTGRRRSRD